MYQKILFATDMSELAINTAKEAKEMADLFKAELHVAHVVEAIPNYGYPNIAEMEEAVHNEAKVQLKALSDKVGIADSHQHIEAGSVKVHVLDIAERLGADLIIVGSHSKHGLADLLGTTANAILHGANCDVLTVRSTSEE